MSRLTQKYQITLPSQAREALGVSKGDEVDFVVTKKGQVLVVATSSDKPFDAYVGYLSENKIKNSDKIVAKLRGE